MTKALCLGLNLTPKFQEVCIEEDPQTLAMKKLNKQILQIAKTDPVKASMLSQKITLCTWTESSLKRLERLGLDTLGILPHPGLLGGGKERWIRGPQMTLSGTNSKIEIFNIPEGCKYKNWKEGRWNITPKNASCSVRYVTANSKAEIDELSKFSSDNQLSAAIQAKGLEMFEIGAGAEGGKNVTRNQHGVHNEKHAHAAIVLTGKTVGGCFGGGRIDVSISICVEENNAKTPSSLRTNQENKYEEDEQKKAPTWPKKTNRPNSPVYLPNYIPSKEESKLERTSTINLNIPPEVACPLIERKLKEPQCQLSVEESLDLLTTCVRYGNANAEKIAEKDAVIVIGNTGAGKSTFVNYLSGCTMVLKSPEELGLDEVDDIVVVKSKSEGGALDEIMPIGHTKKSKTFMPQVETDRATQITYCDCPGFLDNRGAEINIANAVNIKAALTRAKTVKVVILINYHSLRADRGRGLSDMLKICSNLFGNERNLEHYQNSIILGITQVPLSWKLERVQKWITKDTPDIMKTLSTRLFLSDPLDRLLEGGLSREECLKKIRNLDPIPNPDRIFQTVLTDTDEKTLMRIVEKMSEEIQTHLNKNNLPKAAERLRHLKRLTVINHSVVERLLSENKLKLVAHFQKIIDAFKTHCHFENFSSAEKVLEELKEIEKNFPEENNINIKELQNYEKKSKERYRQRQEKERKGEEELRRAQGKIQQLLELLESQKRETKQQIDEQGERFNTMLQEMKTSMKETTRSYDQMKAGIQEEMEAKLRQKEQEIKLAKTLGTQEKRRVEEERRKLEQEYTQKLKEAEKEKESFLENQKAEREKREGELAKQQDKLRKKLEIIENQKAEATEQLKKSSIPKIAFGKAKWEKYFGDVGVEPPLPKDIVEVLKSPCPYWSGKRIEETHMLVLIPQTVNGRPLTLNTLQELIQSPQGGGHATKYSGYYELAQKEIGSQPVSPSYWALMTKDVLPNSRNKNYAEQQALIKGPYVVPGALETATGILMHHVQTGERLYSDSPDTYTRCQEKLSNGYRVVVGSFGPAGLGVSGYYFCDDFRGDDFRGGFSRGLCGLRKF